MPLHQKRLRARQPRDKILTIPAMEAMSARLRAEGEVIVLAHGTFDLLHAGHVRHLQAAASHGTRLIVTVTSDRFVNKGPGRPVFNEHLRAEMLASLEFVDFVAINQAESSVDVLKKIRPHIYAKGSDYADAEKDITGNIRREREAVEAVDGRLVFTEEITFSSSSLLNRYFNGLNPALREYLDRKESEPFLGQMLQLLEQVRDYRVVLVGDTIIDEYSYVSPLGKPPKENLIATSFQGKEVFAGGVIAAANHIAGICKEVVVVTALGGREDHWDLIRTSIKPNVRIRHIVLPDRVTTRKVRYVESGYMRKLFEVYHMDDTPIHDPLASEFAESLREEVRDANLVVVTDFGHGLMTPQMVACVTENAPFLAVNAQTNSANAGFNLITKYPRADYLCIDGPEARLAVSDKYSSIEEIAQTHLPARIDCKKLIVTSGRNGCVCVDPTAGVIRIPAFVNQVVDTVGAGDAFLAITSPLVAAGGGIEHVGFIGNAAGAIKVGILGHRQSVEKLPLIRYLTTLLK